MPRPRGTVNENCATASRIHGRMRFARASSSAIGGCVTLRHSASNPARSGQNRPIGLRDGALEMRPRTSRGRSSRHFQTLQLATARDLSFEHVLPSPAFQQQALWRGPSAGREAHRVAG
eukprot:scaffold1411_cov252-Pinguiococcus_pyrenoidosus.AAC.13